MIRRIPAFLLAATAALALGGCATAPEPALVAAPTCARGQQPMRSELLYFGSAMPQGTVSADDWRGFVDEAITPRFPDGLTVWQASGQWKPAKGTAVREPAWVLSVVHWPDAKSETAITAIVDAYKKRFHQDSVLRVSSEACVTF